MYLAALFAFGAAATLMPREAPADAGKPARKAAVLQGPMSPDLDVKAAPALLRDRLGSDEERIHDGIESDTRDRIKTRPLSRPMT